MVKCPTQYPINRPDVLACILAKNRPLLEEVERTRMSRSTYRDKKITWELVVAIAKGKSSGDNLLD
jgi:hypothetical protein